MKFIIAVSAIAAFLCSCSCQPSDPVAVDPGPESGDKLLITEFSVREYPGVPVTIDNEEHVIDVVLPYGAIPGEAHFEFTVGEDVTARPASGDAVDISEDVSIYLSLPDGNARKYVVRTTVAKSSDVVLTALTDNEYHRQAVIDGNEISFSFPYAADITALTFTPQTIEGTTFDPDITSVPVDLTVPLTVTVTSPDGTRSEKFTITATVEDVAKEVRGVYLPSPSHTSSFITYENVKKSIDLMAELNFNTLFVGSWAATKVSWDSDVLLQNSSYRTASEGNMYASYSGGSGDALRDIIDVAHSKGIKVILWFEYGFMHGIGSVNHNDPVLAKHPEWIGINNSGNYCNYNGTDYYLNGYDPEVQNFMMSLMKEALQKYPEVDGIQGDDRMPAMPRNSGYDEKTVAAYKAENDGKEPPQDCNNPGWVNWRLDRLNAFAKAMSTELKGIKPSLIVCFAPNKYPWCEDNLMQDWPQWIADGAVDLLTVQFYVTSSYENDINTALRYVSQNTDKNILNPAMILKNGSVVMSEEMLISQLQFNDRVGTCGESQFWFDGLLTDYVQKVFRDFYPSKAEFPL